MSVLNIWGGTLCINTTIAYSMVLASIIAECLGNDHRINNICSVDSFWELYNYAVIFMSKQERDVASCQRGEFFPWHHCCVGYDAQQ